MAIDVPYSLIAASLDQQIGAWLLSPILNFLFLMILVKALLELPVFYAGLLLVFVALTFRKRLAIPLRAAGRKTVLNIEQKDKNKRNAWIGFIGTLTLFTLFVGTGAVIFEVVIVAHDVAATAYKTVQDFTDPEYGEGDPLSSDQKAIVERYSVSYVKIQLASLDQDERFVASQIAKHKRDRRWLYVQSVLQHFAKTYAPKLSQKQTSQHFLQLWRELEYEIKSRADKTSSPFHED